MKMFLRIIAILAITMPGFTACDDGDGGCTADCLAIGAEGEGGGIIIYHKHSGFTVTTGTGSFTAYYLEAAPSDQGTILRWSKATDSPYATISREANATAIGTGLNNTALILAGDPAAPAASACKDYNSGGKNDWFLPSKDELNEMYKARDHLGISSGYFWSSTHSKFFSNIAWDQHFGHGWRYYDYKNYGFNVRAVRAF